MELPIHSSVGSAIDLTASISGSFRSANELLLSFTGLICSLLDSFRLAKLSDMSFLSSITELSSLAGFSS